VFTVIAASTAPMLVVTYALVGDRMRQPLDELRPGRGSTSPPS